MSILIGLFVIAVIIAVIPEDETSQKVQDRRARWADFENRLEQNRIAHELTRELNQKHCVRTN